MLSTAQKAFASDADVIRSFGMVGRQALDCSAPFSESNPNVIFATTSTGNVTRTLRMRPDLDGTFAERNFRMVGPNILQFEETGRSTELSVSIMKQRDGTFRSWSSIKTSGPDKGKVLFSDGKRADGSDTLAFKLCGR
jgi:hypothetical protein